MELLVGRTLHNSATMVMRSNAGTVFKWVVDDVIAKVKPEFVQEGVEE